MTKNISKSKDKKLYPVYRKVSVAMPHCPICNEQLLGNNSIAFPWTCSCGKWESSWLQPFNYKIIKEDGNKKCV